LHFGESYNQTLPKKLPESLEYLVFGNDYRQRIPDVLPKSLKTITINQIQSKEIFEKYKIIDCDFHKENKKLNIKMSEK